MKYFITGATGYVGNIAVRQLVSQGHSVTANVRDPIKGSELKKIGIRLFQGDVSDKGSMTASM